MQRRENVDRGKLIEVIDSHKQEEIIKALKQQPLEVREQVEEVSVDMWGGFPKVVKSLRRSPGCSIPAKSAASLPECLCCI